MATLKSLFEHVEWPPESQLFLEDDGMPMSHRFCLGVASLAATIGFNNYEIQLLGRWYSNSYKLYINNSQAHLLSLSSHLHWVIPHGQPYEPPSLLLLSYLA